MPLVTHEQLLELARLPSSTRISTLRKALRRAGVPFKELAGRVFTVFNAALDWFQDYMSGVYLMGLRPHEARDLLRTSITPKGIVFQESKTQKIRQIGWSDALQFFLTRATSRFPNSPYVFTNSKGQGLSEWCVHSMLHRIREQVGGEPFRIQDLRAKAESDHKTGLGLLALYKRRHVTSPVR